MSFKHRGGREKHHEALLFFAISGIGVLIMAAPIFVANNFFDLRNVDSKTTLIIVDFVLNYIVGNLLQMAFRFWALRRWAFPEDMRDAPDQESIPDDETRSASRRALSLPGVRHRILRSTIAVVAVTGLFLGLPLMFYTWRWLDDTARTDLQHRLQRASSAILLQEQSTGVTDEPPVERVRLLVPPGRPPRPQLHRPHRRPARARRRPRPARALHGRGHLTG